MPRRLLGVLDLHVAGVVGAVVVVRGPERQVVAQQLHDERRVLVRLLVERVELGDGVVEGLAGQGQG